MIAAAIGCSRAGTWLIEDGANGCLLRCLGVYDRNTERLTIMLDEISRQVSPFFAALEQTSHVVAVETRSHALTGTER